LSPDQVTWSDAPVSRWLASYQDDLDNVFCLYITIHSNGLYQSCIDRQELADIYRWCEGEIKAYVGKANIQRMTHNEYIVLKRFPVMGMLGEREKGEYQKSTCQTLSGRLQSLISPREHIEVFIGSASSGMRYHMDSIEQVIDLAYVTQRQAQSEHRRWLIADEHIRARKLDVDECKQGFLKEGWEAEFNPFYQPIIDPETFTIVGSESLARWQMGGFRILAAQVFKDVAAELYHIATIDSIIINKTFASIRTMMLARLLPYTFKVVINVSNESLVKGFAEKMHFLAKQNGIATSQIEFDMADYSFTTDESLTAIKDLRELGFKVSLDIFEDTAFDLQAFARADFDTIKLNFIAFTPLLQQVYASLIEAAHEKGVEVVAKGIENREVLNAAINLGCDFVQGNYFTLPIPEQTFKIFMNKYQEGLYVDSLG
jgi:EAL domain-containing protein (putative c-di-GMP-specific phosphodiesterase class I)